MKFNNLKSKFVRKIHRFNTSYHISIICEHKCGLFAEENIEKYYLILSNFREIPKNTLCIEGADKYSCTDILIFIYNFRISTGYLPSLSYPWFMAHNLYLPYTLFTISLDPPFVIRQSSSSSLHPIAMTPKTLRQQKRFRYRVVKYTIVSTVYIARLSRSISLSHSLRSLNY